jgi:hypothetical protein
VVFQRENLESFVYISHAVREIQYLTTTTVLERASFTPNCLLTHLFFEIYIL